MGVIKPIMALCFAAGLATAPVQADSRAEKLNAMTIGLLAPEYQWLPQSISIATAVQHDSNLRVLPILGAGTLQSVSDLAHLESVDAALLTLDTLTYAKAQGLMDGMEGNVTYLARLQPVSWALVVPKSKSNTTMLANLRIATGPTGSAGFVAGELLFNALEIPFSRVPKQGAEALNQLQQGNADAALVDASVLRTSKLSNSRFHILPLPVPQPLTSTYSPTILTRAQAPGLIATGQDVETISSPLAVVVFTGKTKSQQDRLEAFSKALFRNAATLKLNNNIAADIPGWSRHRSSAEALKALATQAKLDSDTALQQGDGQ
jgi:TRAP-type uncharacterized transport system substrate-binding protein